MSSRWESTLGDMNEIMGREDPSDGYLNTPELPSEKLEVRIQLKKKLASVLASLKPDLQKDNMMDVQEDAKLNNVIVVSGLPPRHGYDKNSVLKKVKKHDADASIIPPKKTGK